MSVSVKKGIMGRVYIVFGFIVLAAVSIIGRVAYIQIYLGDSLEQISLEQSYRNQKVEAIRGNIYSSNKGGKQAGNILFS